MKTKDQIQKEALESIGNLQMAGIEVSMGVGKTLTGLKHMAKFWNETANYLVVCPKLEIFESWKKDAAEFGYSELIKCVTFTTYRSLNKQDTDLYDIIYLDECHSLKESHEDWLGIQKLSGRKILGLTGTYPVRKSTEKGKMCNYFCPKVYEYTTDDAVDDDILNDYVIYVHKLALDGKPTIPVSARSGDTFYTSEAKSYNYWSNRLDAASTPKEEQISRIQRMKALQKFPSKENYAQKLLSLQKDKTIVFANTQKQADRLCKYSVHSKNKDSKENLKMFKEGSIDKLSAVEQLSEGVNIPNLKVGIIMHAYGNNRKATQKIGRLLRLNPDEKAIIHILCYYNSVDLEWVQNALNNFDKSKINWIFPT